MLYWSGLPVVALYVRFALVAPTQTAGLAPNVIVGVGLTVTLREAGELLPQVLLAVTVTLPEAAVPQLTVAEVLPCPAVIEAPEGTDQV
jgi:hypothetical protein